jgi:hypothetical protein
MEYLRGARLMLDSTGTQVPVFNDGDSVSFNRPGIYGHCELHTPALFMSNNVEDTCVIAYKPISQQTCDDVDFKRIANLKLQKGDGTGVELTARPGQVRKFSLTNFKEVTLTTEETD